MPAVNHILPVPRKILAWESCLKRHPHEIKRTAFRSGSTYYTPYDEISSLNYYFKLDAEALLKFTCCNGLRACIVIIFLAERPSDFRKNSLKSVAKSISLPLQDNRKNLDCFVFPD